MEDGEFLACVVEIFDEPIEVLQSSLDGFFINV